MASNHSTPRRDELLQSSVIKLKRVLAGAGSPRSAALVRIPLVVSGLLGLDPLSPNSSLPLYHPGMEHPLPDDVLRVTEAELQEKLSTYLDRVTHADEELVVMREGEPIAAIVSVDGLRALRHVVREVEEQLGEERLRMLLGD